MRQWKKGCQAFLTALECKICDLVGLDPEAVTESKKWRWLRQAVLPQKTMEAAITNFDSLDKFARKMTPDGNGLGFQEMFNQLMDASTCHDKVTKDNVANQQRHVQEGKFQLSLTKKAPRVPVMERRLMLQLFGSIIYHKIARRNGQQLSSAVLNLNFSDLPTIVNGTAADAIADKPFNLHFNREKILWSWAKIGFVPFTRSCLKNRRVRKECGQHTRDKALEDLQFRYDVLVDKVEGQGFNPGVFYALIPVATHVERAETEAEQVEQLLKSGKAFPASGHCNHCQSCIGNAAGVTF